MNNKFTIYDLKIILFDKIRELILKQKQISSLISKISNINKEKIKLEGLKVSLASCDSFSVKSIESSIAAMDRELEDLNKMLKYFSENYDYDKHKSFQVVLSKIKYHLELNVNDFEVIINVMDEKKVADKDQVAVLATLRRPAVKNNRRINVNYGNNERVTLNILKLGLEDLSIPEKNHHEVSPEAKYLISIMDYYNNVTIDFLNQVALVLEKISDDRKIIILRELLQHIQMEFLDIISFISTKDIYNEKTLKREVIDSYIYKMNSYLRLRELMDAIESTLINVYPKQAVIKQIKIE